jgi:hypothetical protein
MKHLLNCRIGWMACCVVVMTVAYTTLFESPAKANEIDSTRSRFLILDSRLLGTAENAVLKVGTVQKSTSNPLFGEDKPWEKRFDNLYGNVMYDKQEKIYKCWYSPFIVDRSAKGMTLEQRQKRYSSGPGREMGICYATSKDGIKWEKPELGLVEYEGSKANNIIWRGPHGAGIFKDPFDSNASRRYKMIMQGVKTSYSADGIHWSNAENINLRGIAGDTHNNAFWNSELKKYVGITRTWGKKGREVTRIESLDFKKWTSTGVVMEALNRGAQPYAMPVFRHGGVYLGLLASFGHEDRTRSKLAWSPDSIKWHRIDPDADLIPNSEKILDYDYGCVYACAYPVFLDNEIRLYYGGSDYKHGGWRTGNLSLATLRPDGFAGYEQKSKDKPAVITTTAISYAGQEIRITADVAHGGSIKVSLVDDQGKDVVTAGTVSTTVTDGRLKWSKKISADKIRLKFEIHNAKLYSFSFAEKNM